MKKTVSASSTNTYKISSSSTTLLQNEQESVMSKIRHATNLETDRQRMEYIAAKRNELKQVIHIIQKDKDDTDGSKNGQIMKQKKDDDEEQGGGGGGGNYQSEFFVLCPWKTSGGVDSERNATTNISSSFFLMDNKTTEKILHNRLKQTEKELVGICEAVQRQMDSMQ